MTNTQQTKEALSFNKTLIAADSHYWNTISFDQYKLISYSNYQYTIYWNEQLQLVLARRSLQSNQIEQVIFPDVITEESNSHLNTVIGISPKDGTLHLAYDHHGHSTINYRVSKPGFITTPPASISIEQFSEKQNILAEESITYPRFFNDAKDNLYLSFRQGISGAGHKFLYRYHASLNKWSKIGLVFSGMGNAQNPTRRNAYLQDLIFDAKDRLHATWVYREDAYSHSTNHGLYYAYSDDNGLTWQNNIGEVIANLKQNKPIQIGDPHIQVIDIPQNSWVLNQGAMTLDQDQQPQLLMSRSDKVTSHIPDTNVHYIHYWRKPNGEWQQQYIYNTQHTVGSGPNWREIFNFRGDIAIDQQNKIYATLPMPNHTLLLATATAPTWQDWSIRPLSLEKITGTGQKYDRILWQEKQLLSLPVTIEENGETSYNVIETQAYT